MADDRDSTGRDDAGAPLPADAAAVLASWAACEPPPGFADRVVAATHARSAPAPRRRRWLFGAAIAATGMAATALVVLRGGAATSGARVIEDRETIALGDRGVAVAEAGTEISWTISAAGAADVHQTRGDVFYRVEHGGPFAVETPYGQVIVRGTCFRVEVLNMKVARQTWTGGAVGAALAATIVITVYEGRIRVVNARGQADAKAGERVALGAGGAPAQLGPGGPAGDLAALDPPPPSSVTVPELLRRDQSHRGEIALLRARVRTLESASATGAPESPPAHSEGTPIVDLPHDELVAMAKKCEVRFDVPGYGIEPRTTTDKIARQMELSDDERVVYDRLMRGENDRYMAALHALYRELTGSEGGDNLDASALAVEVFQKSPRSDVLAARQRLAEERAGLAPPPPDLQSRSVIERMLRLQTSAGGALEQQLAAELGPDRAHQLRLRGWAGGSTHVMSGCED